MVNIYQGGHHPPGRNERLEVWRVQGWLLACSSTPTTWLLPPLVRLVFTVLDT
jgi:hypothetical protein